MNHKNLLTFEEVSNLFCMEKDELEDFLETRNFNIEPIHSHGETLFPLEEIQKHLQSQYFI